VRKIGKRYPISDRVFLDVDFDTEEEENERMKFLIQSDKKLSLEKKGI
jgi:hypothetical protein